LLPKPELPGYALHDGRLQDLLFGATLIDETPDGPTRTWVYNEGTAGESGRFEPIPDGADPAARQPDATVPPTRIETSRAARPSWEPPRAPSANRNRRRDKRRVDLFVTR
jgi:hypothetical protein